MGSGEERERVGDSGEERERVGSGEERERVGIVGKKGREWRIVGKIVHCVHLSSLQLSRVQASLTLIMAW